MGARERERKRQREINRAIASELERKNIKMFFKIFTIIHFSHLISSLKISKIAFDKSVPNNGIRKRRQ